MQSLIHILQGRWLKHPLHPALVHIPTALWPSAWLADLVSRYQADNSFVQLSFYAIALGLIAAIPAIPTGLADWSEVGREKPAWKLGLYHLVLNVIVFILWAINAWLRIESFRTATSVPVGLVWLSTVATVLLLVSGYLGGRMIYDYGISVARLSKTKWRAIAKRGGAAVPSKDGK